MPRIKSAKKALRQSEKHQKANLIWKNRLKIAIKTAMQAISKKEKDAGKLTSKAISIADICVKKNLYHQNKINRLKRKLLKKLNESKIKLEKRERKIQKAKPAKPVKTVKSAGTAKDEKQNIKKIPPKKKIEVKKEKKKIGKKPIRKKRIAKSV